MAVLFSVDMSSEAAYEDYRHVSASSAFSHRAAGAFDAATNAARFTVPSNPATGTYSGLSLATWTPSNHVSVGFCIYFGPTFINACDGASGSNKILILQRTSLAGIVVDTFTETSDTVLTSHTPGTGGAWSVPNGTFTVSGANDWVTLGSGQEFAWNAATPSSADYWVEVTGRTGSNAATDRFGVCVRGDGGQFGAAGTDCYYAYINGAGSLVISEMGNGSVTSPGSYSGDYTIPSFSTSTEYTLRLQVVGTAITAYLNGSAVATATDATISTAGQVGIYLRGSNANITSMNSQNDITNNPRIIQNWRNGDGSSFPAADHFGFVDNNVDHTVAQVVAEHSIGPVDFNDYSGQWLYFVSGVNASGNRRYFKIWDRTGQIQAQEGTLSRTDGLFNSNDQSAFFDITAVDANSWYDISHYEVHDSEILEPPAGFITSASAPRRSMTAAIRKRRMALGR